MDSILVATIGCHTTGKGHHIAMGKILLGHGALDVDPRVTRQDMEFVAIPRGTTIQFYADAGQDLLYGADELDVWERMRAPWPPLDSRDVSYNLVLDSGADFYAADLVNAPRFGGHELIRPGFDGLPDRLRLCAGTPATCPTDPREALRGAVHRCAGVLGRYGGEDLYWLACTTVLNADRAVLHAALDGRPRAVLLGADPDWMPTESDLRAVANVNAAAVADTGEGGFLPFCIAGDLLLIGRPDGCDDHDARHRAHAQCHDDVFYGTLVVYRPGGIVPAGGFDFKDVPQDQHERVTRAVRRFSDGEVRFTYWVPDRSDLEAAVAANRSAVDGAAEGELLPYVAAGSVVLVGDRHDPRLGGFVRRRPDHFEGTLGVYPGWLVGQAPPGAGRELLERHLSEQFPGVEISLGYAG